MTAAYPERAAARRQWTTAHRGSRRELDAFRPHTFFIEEECDENRQLAQVLTVFLTNRECPWRCLMCDLWKDTLPGRTPIGAIPAQMDHAVSILGTDPSRPPTMVKLYNSGSFFDQNAVPREDYPAIADRCRRFRRVTVECHPRLVTDEAPRFRDMLGTDLEVAMGLETAHEGVLEKLNKGMTLEHFWQASNYLDRHGIGVRAFVLLRPPFMNEAEGREWAKRSIEFAFDCGVAVVSVIPTRTGNGAMEALAATGEFAPPSLTSLEEVLDYGINLGRGRVFADLWGLEQFSTCAICFEQRRARLQAINHTQEALPRVKCERCNT